MKKWSLADAGFKYDVVAVFGSQSTGKSKSIPVLFFIHAELPVNNQLTSALTPKVPY